METLSGHDIETVAHEALHETLSTIPPMGGDPSDSGHAEHSVRQVQLLGKKPDNGPDRSVPFDGVVAVHECLSGPVNGREQALEAVCAVFDKGEVEKIHDLFKVLDSELGDRVHVSMDLLEGGEAAPNIQQIVQQKGKRSRFYRLESQK